MDAGAKTPRHEEPGRDRRGENRSRACHVEFVLERIIAKRRQSLACKSQRYADREEMPETEEEMQAEDDAS
jgi:hypothetical protein